LEAKKNTPLIFAIIHGGHEYYPLPSPRIKKLFHYLVDLGVSAVIGHHSHVLSGFEIYKQKPLIYSIGNFIFDEPENQIEDWFLGALAVLTIDLDNNIQTEFCYIEQSKKLPSITTLDSNRLTVLKNKLLELSLIISDDFKLASSWTKFAQEMQLNLLKQITGLNLIKRALLKFGLFKSQIFRKDKLLVRLSIIQCESHRDLLIDSLKNQLDKK
jgi:poly-gamma-glutamate synthesis protein (capsule biosynthesis protein)